MRGFSCSKYNKDFTHIWNLHLASSISQFYSCCKPPITWKCTCKLQCWISEMVLQIYKLLKIRTSILLVPHLSSSPISWRSSLNFLVNIYNPLWILVTRNCLCWVIVELCHVCLSICPIWQQVRNGGNENMIIIRAQTINCHQIIVSCHHWTSLIIILGWTSRTT